MAMRYSEVYSNLRGDRAGIMGLNHRLKDSIIFEPNRSIIRQNVLFGPTEAIYGLFLNLTFCSLTYLLRFLPGNGI